MIPKPNNISLVFFLSFVTVFSGCSIKTGPNALLPPTASKEPVMRVGEIKETLTGTWATSPSGKPSGFRSAVIDVLKQPQVASRFSNSSSNLTMNIDLVSDHEDDGPRLSNLGMLSMVTIGIIPLNYFSEWNVDCSITVDAPDGTRVADYIFQERGTYKIWAFPLTMLTLSGAGIRGDHDARVIYEKVANGLAAKMTEAIDQDYDKLAGKIGKQQTPEAENVPDALPKPVVM